MHHQESQSVLEPFLSNRSLQTTNAQNITTRNIRSLHVSGKQTTSQICLLPLGIFAVTRAQIYNKENMRPTGLWLHLQLLQTLWLRQGRKHCHSTSKDIYMYFCYVNSFIINIINIIITRSFMAPITSHYTIRKSIKKQCQRLRHIWEINLQAYRQHTWHIIFSMSKNWTHANHTHLAHTMLSPRVSNSESKKETNLDRQDIWGFCCGTLRPFLVPSMPRHTLVFWAMTDRPWQPSDVCSETWR